MCYFYKLIEFEFERPRWIFLIGYYLSTIIAKFIEEKIQYKIFLELDLGSSLLFSAGLIEATWPVHQEEKQ